MSARKEALMNTANEVGQSTVIGRQLRIMAIESEYEILKLLRTTAFVVPTLTFPVLFYLFFGVAFGGRASGGSWSMGVYLIATYGAFGVIGAALSSFGAGIAIERSQGWLQMKHATPMPLHAYLVAKLSTALLFAAIINLIYLPMSFHSGLWIPVDLLPRGIQSTAELLPAYHL